MGVLDWLFGWTGYEPLGFLMSGLNVALNGVFGCILHFYPLRRFLRVRPHIVVLAYAGLYTLFVAFFLSFPELLANAGEGQIVGVILGSLVLGPFSFLLLKNCALQNLFAIAYSMCFSLFVMGAGNWMDFRFGDVLLPEVNSIVAFVTRLVLSPVFLPLGIRSLERLITAWSGDENADFWKVAWMIPTALFVLPILAGNIRTLTAENSLTFLLTRVLSMVGLLVCVAMMTGIMYREREMAETRMRRQMMDAAGKALDESYAEALSLWRRTDGVRREAGAVVRRIINCTQTGRRDEITRLLREQLAGLETPIGRVCENESVNALVVYYAAIARREGMEFTCKLDVPRQAGRVANVDLSRVVGNMLENAIEACRRMEYGTKSIRLQSMVTGEMLVFGLVNSFDGGFEPFGEGRYYSRKRHNNVATGLTSIQSVADKYNGTAKFEADGRVFKTSIRLDMGRLQ